MRAHSFPIQKEAAKTSMLMLHRHLEFDSCLRLAHRIPKIGKGSSLPMDPMARRPPKRNLLPVLRVCNEGGRRSNKTTWISRFEYTDPSGPSQQASVYQNLSVEPDLSRSLQHRRPKWPFSSHTRFGCKKIPQEKGGGGNDKLFLVNAQKVHTIFNKNVLAQTIKGQEQRFRRLVHILCIPNGKIAS
jgi:hypothetical protein